MKSLWTLAATMVATGALAHGPTPIKVDESIVIAADPQAVWAVAGQFGDIAKWHPDVTAATIKGGNAAGAEREITLKGGVLKEGLDEIDPADFKLSYRMSDPNLDALPVSSYTVTFTIKPAEGGGSQVAWYGRLYRGYTGNDPPENLDDEAARTAMSTFLRDGLQGLKKKVEGK
ncbi:SRPBCC family protein [Methylocapsa palsarum]|uniref:MxaD protein n=1 Tax=Methylocapsa palsarum TaxID=1612308 RepID=A0A1I4AXA0_9HYPH|nr:SRPBCC family protein [Methylocapsa palsarum]SFK61178.1 mxaD protein [Methylocapsa palsarum]